MRFLQQFDNMSLKCFQKLNFLFLMLVLVVPALQIDWQGSGNMTRDNMTEIQTLINSRTINFGSSADAVDEDGVRISTRLNNLWAPAWNVVLVMDSGGLDSIVYGYAFRSHWMWINKLILTNAPSTKVSYVIWKDYNCHTWGKINTLMGSSSTFTSDQLSVVNQYTPVKKLADIWGLGHEVVEYVNTHSLFNTGAYTAVMSQGMASFYGYICLVNKNYVMRRNMEDYLGAMFLFQTR